MIPKLFNADDTDGHGPSVQLLLVLLQASLGFVLVCILVFFLVDYGPKVSIPSGVAVHLVGFMTTWLLSARVPRLFVLWSAAFAIVPLLLTPFAGYRYFADGLRLSFGFWLGFSVSLLAASLLGGTYGVRRNRSLSKEGMRDH